MPPHGHRAALQVPPQRSTAAAATGCGAHALLDALICVEVDRGCCVADPESCARSSVSARLLSWLQPCPLLFAKHSGCRTVTCAKATVTAIAIAIAIAIARRSIVGDRSHAPTEAAGETGATFRRVLRAARPSAGRAARASCPLPFMPLVLGFSKAWRAGSISASIRAAASFCTQRTAHGCCEPREYP